MPRKETGRLDEGKLFDRIHWIVEYGFVVQTSHFRKELREAGADMQDVRHILLDQKTQLLKASYNRQRRSWKYKIEGGDLSDMLLTIVLCLDLKNSRLILITAW